MSDQTRSGLYSGSGGQETLAGGRRRLTQPGVEISEQLRLDPHRYFHEMLLPPNRWSQETLTQWKTAVDGWYETVGASRPLVASQVDFTKAEVDACTDLYVLACQISHGAPRSKAEQTLADRCLEDAFDRFFPDDMFIGENQIPEALKELVVRPAMMTKIALDYAREVMT
jgi:hypothetical protein